MNTHEDEENQFGKDLHTTLLKLGLLVVCLCYNKFEKWYSFPEIYMFQKCKLFWLFSAPQFAKSTSFAPSPTTWELSRMILMPCSTFIQLKVLRNSFKVPQYWCVCVLYCVLCFIVFTFSLLAQECSKGPVRHSRCNPTAIWAIWILYLTPHFNLKLKKSSMCVCVCVSWIPENILNLNIYIINCDSFSC